MTVSNKLPAVTASTDAQGRRTLTHAEAHTITPEQLVDACFDLIGPVQPSERTRAALARHVAKTGPLDLAQGGRAAEDRVGELLQMVVSTRELQWV